MISDTIGFINKVLSKRKTASWEKIYPFYPVEDDILITRKGDYSVIYELTLPDIHSLGESDYETLARAFASLVDGMDRGYCIQRYDFVYPALTEISVAGHSFAGYRDQLQAISKKSSQVKSYLVITRIATQNRKRSAGNAFIELATGKKISGLFDKNHYKGEELENFKSKVDNILEVLEKGLAREKNIKADRLRGDRINELIQSMYLNLDFFDNSYPAVRNSIEEHDAFGTSGQRIFNVFSLRPDGIPPLITDAAYDAEYSKEGVFSLPVSYLHYAGYRLPFPHILVTSIFTRSKDEVLEKLGKKVKVFRNTAFASAYNGNQAESISRLLENFEGKNTVSMVDMDFSVIVAGNVHDPKEYIKSVAETKAYFNRFKMLVSDNGYNNLAAFFARIPGCGSDIPEEECAVVLSSHAACFQLLESGINSVENGILLYDRKTGSPFSMDLFEHPAITNKNMAIFGPSGTGKSFTFNHLVRSYIDSDHSVIMIDLGGSYEYLNKYVGGINFKCSEAEPLTLNPFLFVKKTVSGSWQRPSEDDSEFITNLIFTAWQSANSKAKITSEVNAVLKELIIGFFDFCNESGAFPDFTEFYHYAKGQLKTNSAYSGLSDRHFDKESFLLVMRAFIKEGRGEKEGQYGYLFNTHENPDVLGNPFVIFELEQIKENKVLLPISFYIVTRIVLEKLLKRADKRKRIYYILDEAWMLLAREDLGEVAGLFIEYSFRTFRKHGGSISIATQNVTDILSNQRVGAAILQNCDTLLIKKQDEKNMELIREKLNLNEHNCNLLFSIKDKHKELYLQFKDQAMVAKIETSLYNVGMYSTDPRHKEFIRQELERNGNNLHGALIKFEDNFSKHKN